MTTFIVILVAGAFAFGAYQIPAVKQQLDPIIQQAQPYVEALKNVKTEPTGTVIDRPELMPKD